MVYIWILILALYVCDVFAYTQAKWPERTWSFIYRLPLGGFLALWKFGRDK